ncbi:unnamed protein product [Prorocentrum cordatum]|uniref:ADP ribosyltransferase domain-containing protein n=1 Tax=Prorocentrum cordatum TaxID=2364126 RepID=A0ABN9SQE8_9DINO|nr:unnamed protein product [Polarella glacialis]
MRAVQAAKEEAEAAGAAPDPPFTREEFDKLLAENKTLRAENAKLKESKTVDGGKGVPAVGLGDELQALPTEKYEGFFDPGDKGRVSSEPYIGDDGKQRFKVTWYRTGKTSTRVAEGWMRSFRFADESDTEHVNAENKKHMEDAVKDVTNQPAGKPIELISGQPKAAAMGLYHFMRVSDPFAEDSANKVEKEITQFVQKLREYAMILGYHNDVPEQREHIEHIYGKESVAEAKDEIDYFRKVARLPDDSTALAVASRVEEETLGNIKYILYEKASEVFVAGPDGIRDKGRGPVGIQDFMKNKTVADAELTLAHVVALRFYTTPGYKYLNSPFRNQDRYYHKNKQHPMPITMAYISEGIKKLRSAYAVKVEEGQASTHMVLWRGLRNMYMPDDFLLNRKGGTELAPMSTTTDIQVAARYACSGESVLLKISLDNFMQYGAELGWLSAFPGEVEVLYPPLTYLQPTGKPPQVVELSTGVKFTVHEVTPTIP